MKYCFEKMNAILPKTRLPSIRCSMHKIRNRLVNLILKCNDVDRVKSKEALIFLQNGFSKISLGCTSAIPTPKIPMIQKRNCPDTPGSGAGKTGGWYERIGSVGKFGDISEEQFFYKKNKAQIEQLKLELEKKGKEKNSAPEKKEE